jgi:hypothetical protein
MIAIGYIVSTTDSTTSSVPENCDSCSGDYAKYTVTTPPSLEPVKRKLTKWEKRDLFKIADQKHSRRSR